MEIKYLALFTVLLLSVSALLFAGPFDIDINFPDFNFPTTLCPYCENLQGYTPGEFFVTTNEEEKKFDVSFFYRSVDGQTEERKPIKAADVLVFTRKSSGFTSELFDYKKTNSEGKFSFDFTNYKDECHEFTFIYCPAYSGCGFTNCLAGAGLNTTQIANAPTHLLSDPNRDPHDIMPSVEKVTRCPAPDPVVFNDLPPFCLPLALIFALLAGAMYISGRNPFVGFDFSTPRMQKPFRYTARARGVSFDPSAAVQGVIGGMKSGKAEASSLSSSVKEKGVIKGTLSQLGDWKRANPIAGKFANVIQGSKLAGLAAASPFSKVMRTKAKKEGAELSKGKAQSESGFQTPQMRMIGGAMVAESSGETPGIIRTISKLANLEGSFLTKMGVFFNDMMLGSSVGIMYNAFGGEELNHALERSLYNGAIKTTSELEKGKMVFISSRTIRGADGKTTEEDTFVEVKVGRDNNGNMIATAEVVKRVNGAEVSREVPNPKDEKITLGVSKAKNDVLKEYASNLNTIATLGPPSLKDTLGAEKYQQLYQAYEKQYEEKSEEAEKAKDAAQDRYDALIDASSKSEGISQVLDAMELSDNDKYRIAFAGQFKDDAQLADALAAGAKSRGITMNQSDALLAAQIVTAGSSLYNASETLSRYAHPSEADFDARIARGDTGVITVASLGNINSDTLTAFRTQYTMHENAAEMSKGLDKLITALDQKRDQINTMLSDNRGAFDKVGGLSAQNLDIAAKFGQDSEALAKELRKNNKGLTYDEAGVVAQALISQNEVNRLTDNGLTTSATFSLALMKGEMYSQAILAGAKSDVSERVTNSAMTEMVSGASIVSIAGDIASRDERVPDSLFTQKYYEVNPEKDKLKDNAVVLVRAKDGTTYTDTYGNYKTTEQVSNTGAKVYADESASKDHLSGYKKRDSIDVNTYTTPIGSDDPLVAQNRNGMADYLRNYASRESTRAEIHQEKSYNRDLEMAGREDREDTKKLKADLRDNPVLKSEEPKSPKPSGRRRKKGDDYSGASI